MYTRIQCLHFAVDGLVQRKKLYTPLFEEKTEPCGSGLSKFQSFVLTAFSSCSITTGDTLLIFIHGSTN